jgi:hypothetical protein
VQSSNHVEAQRETLSTMAVVLRQDAEDFQVANDMPDAGLACARRRIICAGVRLTGLVKG